MKLSERVIWVVALSALAMLGFLLRDCQRPAEHVGYDSVPVDMTWMNRIRRQAARQDSARLVEALRQQALPLRDSIAIQKDRIARLTRLNHYLRQNSRVVIRRDRDTVWVYSTEQDTLSGAIIEAQQAVIGILERLCVRLEFQRDSLAGRLADARSEAAFVRDSAWVDGANYRRHLASLEQELSETNRKLRRTRWWLALSGAGNAYQLGKGRAR